MEPSILLNLTRSRILHMLVKDGPATAPDISRALSLPSYVVSRELERLALADLVRSDNPIPGQFDSTFDADAPQICQEMAQVRNYLGLET